MGRYAEKGTNVKSEEMNDKNVKGKGNKRIRDGIEILLNALIFAFTLLGIGIMLHRNGNDGGLLSSSGWENFKYFTVLSNVFCGIVAGVYLVTWGLRKKGKTRSMHNDGKIDTAEPMTERQKGRAAEEKDEMAVEGKDGPTAIWTRESRALCPVWLMVLKLAAAAGVMVTFLVVACFFGPLYTYPVLYRGSNLWFHLIIPLLGMVEFCLLDGEIPFRMTFLTGAPALVYGCFYMGNILINGKGQWPDTNDWYGFVNWGWGPAMVIFACIVLTNWGAACLLRWLNHVIHKALNGNFK